MLFYSDEGKSTSVECDFLAAKCTHTLCMDTLSYFDLMKNSGILAGDCPGEIGKDTVVSNDTLSHLDDDTRIFLAVKAETARAHMQNGQVADCISHKKVMHPIHTPGHT